MNDNGAFDFGVRVKEERTKLGMTQKELGKAIDIGEDSIACYETFRYPPVDRLKRLARVLHVSVDYLLGMETTPKINVSDLSDEERTVIYAFVKTFIDKNSRGE